MKIQIQDILKEFGSTISLDFDEKLDDIELRQEIYSFPVPVHFEGSLANTGKMLHLSGTLEAEYSTLCAKCCEKVDVKLNIPIQEDFIRVDASEQDDTRDEEEELYRYTGNEIDITDVLRDNIILNLPFKTVCSPECKGLCPVCGANRNKVSCSCSEEKINPMMEKLKDFFKESRNENEQ